MSFLLINTCQNESWVVLANEEKILREERWQSSRASADLLERVERICADEKIEKIGVVTGPGGFTSARVGVVVANALAQSWGVKVVGISGFIEPDELLAEMNKNAGDDLAKPFYQYPPHITSPKK